VGRVCGYLHFVARIKGRKRLLLERCQTNEFDAQCLFELPFFFLNPPIHSPPNSQTKPKETYGYGSSMWPKDFENAARSSSCFDWMGGDPNVFKEKLWRL